MTFRRPKASPRYQVVHVKADNFSRLREELVPWHQDLGPKADLLASEEAPDVLLVDICGGPGRLDKFREE
jgi:hypothetical protein